MQKSPHTSLGTLTSVPALEARKVGDLFFIIEVMHVNIATVARALF